MIDLFEFINYRDFLSKHFEKIQDRTPKFSYRVFALQAGFTSPNFIQQVIAGTRKLNIENTQKMIQLLNLKSEHSEYFTWLVNFEHARKHDEKNHWYSLILSKRKVIAEGNIELKQMKYFSKWYHPVVRELICHPNFKGDLLWLSSKIWPRITQLQIDASIKLLLELEMIEPKYRAPGYILTESQIRTSTQIPNSVVANFHRSMIKLGADSIESFKSEERDIRAVVASLDQKSFEKLKLKTEKFWAEVMELSNESEASEKVYEMNMQLFPLTKNSQRGKVK